MPPDAINSRPAASPADAPLIQTLGTTSAEWSPSDPMIEVSGPLSAGNGDLGRIEGVDGDLRRLFAAHDAKVIREAIRAELVLRLFGGHS